MGPVQVDPAALEATAAQIRQATVDVDGLRLDLLLRVGVVGPALDDAARAAGAELLAAADQFLVAARNELAGIYEYATAVAAAARQADAPNG